MSENTKINSKGDMMMFKLNINSIEGRTFKKYVSVRVSQKSVNNIG